MNPFLVLLFIIPGSIIFFLGRYIGNTGYVEVLKSYNDKLTYNKEALTTYVSRLMKTTSLLTVGLSVTAFILSFIIKSVDFVTIYLIIYAVVTLNYMIRLRMSCKKFEIKE